MAGQTITQRIALEGGAAIKQQLIDIGNAGKEAFKNFTDAVKAAPAFADFTANLEAIKAKAAEVGQSFSELGNGFRELGSKIGETVKRVGEIGLAIIGAATAFALLVKSGADAAEQTKNAAAALGLTTAAYQELAFAASQAGVSQDKFATGEGRLARAIDQVTQQTEADQRARDTLLRDLSKGTIQTGDYAKKLLELNDNAARAVNPFTRLGISIGEITDKSTSFEDKQNLVADGFKRLEDGTQKTAEAMQLFGRGNVEFANFMNLGSEGIQKQREEAQKLLIPLDKLTIQTGEELVNAFRKLDQVSSSARTSILSVFNPLLTRVVDAFTDSIVRNRATLVTLASDIASKITPTVNDFIAILEGRDADVKNQFLLTARDNIVQFGVDTKHAITDIIIPAFTLLIDILGKVATAINFVFGSNFTGGELAVAVVITRITGLFGLLGGAVNVAKVAIGLLVEAVGAVPIAIGVIGFAIGFTLVKALEKVDWAGFATGAVNAFKTIVVEGSNFVAILVKLFTGDLSGAARLAAAEFNKLSDAAKKAALDAQAAAGSVGAGTEGNGAGGGGGGGFASGGPVRGPGSGTSDSIRAWLSNGEFVNNAKSVRKYGREIFHALNKGLVSIHSVRALMGSGVNLQGLAREMSDVMPRTHFASGGPVMAGAVASVAGGGLVQAHIHFGGDTFPVFSDASVVNAMSRAALKTRRLRAGKAPGSVGG